MPAATQKPAVDLERLALWAAALLPLGFLALLVIAKLAAPGGYLYLTREDGPVEWLTFLVYLAALPFALALARRLLQAQRPLLALLYGLLALGMFLVAMEEISWGQRVFGVATPEGLAGVNEKQELNFHNIGGFPLHAAFIAVGFYGAFARLLAPAFLNRRYPLAVELLTPPRALFLYFFVPMTLYAYYEYVYYRHVAPLGVDWATFWAEGHFIIGKDQEPIELLLALGFLLFVAWNWYRSDALPASARERTA